MKNKVLSLILILLYQVSFGQQVPDTETFDLDTVVAVVNPTTDDLQDCFNDTIAGYFNQTYKASYYAAAGDKLNLLMFRDYGSHNAANYCIGDVAQDDGDNSYTVYSCSSVLTGDLLVLVVISESSSGLSTVPSGWSYRAGAGSGYPFIQYYAKTATSDGQVSATLTQSAIGDSHAIIFNFTEYSNTRLLSPSWEVGNDELVTPSYTALSTPNFLISLLGVANPETPSKSGSSWLTPYIGAGYKSNSGYRFDYVPSWTNTTTPLLTYSWSSSYNYQVFMIEVY